ALARRRHAVVPDPLEVGGHVALTATGDEKVSAKLEVERDERGIGVSPPEPGEPLIRGARVIAILWPGKLQLDPAGEDAMVAHMRGTQPCVRSVGREESPLAGGARV